MHFFVKPGFTCFYDIGQILTKLNQWKVKCQLIWNPVEMGKTEVLWRPAHSNLQIQGMSVRGEMRFRPRGDLLQRSNLSNPTYQLPDICWSGHVHRKDSAHETWAKEKKKLWWIFQNSGKNWLANQSIMYYLIYHLFWQKLFISDPTYFDPHSLFYT